MIDVALRAAARIGAREAARRKAALADAARGALPGVSVREEGETIVLEGRRLNARMADDPALRFGIGAR